MRRIPAFMLIIVSFVTGCEQTDTSLRREAEIDALLAESYRQRPIDNAIIAQHTLYPYHFIVDGAELNELGKHDLGILANHFKKRSGCLNVRQGGASDELYKARLMTVINGMQAAGVPMQKMTVADDLPGGDGMVSDRVVKILEKPSPAVGLSASTTGFETIGIETGE